MNGEKQQQTLLTISIPTWNRAAYLKINLEQLATQIQAGSSRVEILISDNCSSDETPDIVADFIARGLPLRSIRNSENIGSDCNIAQCFNEAAGRYVLILGDDDLLIDGALDRIVNLLEGGQYGVLVMRPYGYDQDFRLEYPGGGSTVREFTDLGKFVVAMGPFSTLISAIIIAKEQLPEVDARQFCGSNLVQTELVYRAAMAAKVNLCTEQYLVACKRNNTGGYAFSQVFVDYLGAVLDDCQKLGLPRAAVHKLERRLLIGHFPYYMFRQRFGEGGEDLQVAWLRFRARYAGQWAFWLFVAPIFRLPKPLALVWGAAAVAVGRVVNGDARRGIYFIVNKLSGKVRHS